MIAVLTDAETDAEIGAGLGRALRRRGEDVVVCLCGDESSPVADPVAGSDGVVARRGRADTGDEVAELLRRAEAGAARPLRAVVLASAGACLTTPTPLIELPAAGWRAGVEAPLRRTLACFQGSYRCLRAGGGTLVLLVPSLALVGAAGLAPWATVAEGQRSLAKAAARAWGPHGIRVNCVAVAAALLAPGARFERPGSPDAALAVADHDAVAAVVAGLSGERWRAVTGATVSADGGVWMTP